ncbi:MAG: transcriptional regulator [Chitinophagaceae bacterium]
MMFKNLDPILHSQLRLAVVSMLMKDEFEFNQLKEQTNASSGNLSVQIQKLKDAGYIEILKLFRNNYPLTVCRITAQGRQAYDEYVRNLREYLGQSQ